MTCFTLDDAQRELLDALLDQIIPASDDGRIPAAGAFGVADFIIGRAVADPELGQLILHGLEKAAAFVDADGIRLDPAAVRQLEQEAPASFEALLRQAYMGYYSRGDIRGLLGLSPKPVHPDGYDVPEQDLDEIRALTAPVMERGPCYRDV
ncbi:MAG: gluconate 2-dehydrogenase subunit 3 family protein [Geminicoccaceae bacterium]